MAHVLYITYDGLTDPLGRSQILPYLTGLARRGHQITILSCEKEARLAASEAIVQRICDEAGIKWCRLKYRNRPPVLAHAWLLLELIRTARRLQRRERFDLLHCRSYIPAMAGLSLKRRFGVKLLFDMRGFWADEKLEGGSWPQSSAVYRAVYRYVKKAEKGLVEGADHLVSLTEEGKRVMLTWPELAGAAERITVIPCCVDFAHFPLPDREARTKARKRLGISEDSKVVCYLGSLGTWYMPSEMLDFFRVYSNRHEGARFLIITPDAPAPIRAAARARGVAPESLVITPATREEVPALMSAADIGLFFIRPVSSKAASSPTKMGEILALGLPTVANEGIGDVARILEATGTGVAVSSFDDPSYQRAIETVEGIALRPGEIRKRALPWFDAEMGIERYDQIYRRMAVVDDRAVSRGSGSAFPRRAH
jgi:hypothetical protein